MEQDKRIAGIEAALQDFDEKNGLKRQVKLRGQEITVRVISVDPGLLLLNPDNFRIHSQLIDSPLKKEVTSDPTSEKSQKIISDLLSSTKDFKKLTDQLKEFGQQEPGLISWDGLLVNGNTRAVALRKLGIAGMLVGVLPKSANNKDLLLIQSDLQMQRWIHQDYSFTNELFFLEELRETLKLSSSNIVSRLGWQSGKRSEKKLEKKFRLLELIREVQRLSSTPIPYSYFDDKQQILEDIDADYQKEKEIDFARAEKLKREKFIAMVRGLTKDQVRIIDATWIDDEQDQDDDIFPEDDSQKAKIAISNYFGEEGYQSPEDQDEMEKAKQQRAAAENAINKKRMRNMLTKPNDILADATSKINDLLLELSDISSREDFETDSFLENVGQLENSYQKLMNTVEDIRARK